MTFTSTSVGLPFGEADFGARTGSDNAPVYLNATVPAQFVPIHGGLQWPCRVPFVYLAPTA